MQAVNVVRGTARSFLTHLFGAGLDEDRYVAEHPAQPGGGFVTNTPRRRLNFEHVTELHRRSDVLLVSPPRCPFHPATPHRSGW